MFCRIYYIRVIYMLIRKSVQKVENIGNYYKSFPILSKTNSGKKTMINNLAKEYNSTIVNLNFELSKKLKMTPTSKRWIYI